MPSVSVPAAIVGGSLISSNAASSAASQQAATANSQIALAQNEFNTNQANLAPFLSAGQGALGALQQGLGLTSGQSSPVANGQLLQNFNPTQAQLAATPGYQFTLGQGLEATQNGFASQGLASSGAAQKGAANYAEGLASTTYQQQFQNYLAQNAQLYQFLGGLSGSGQNAAVQQGSLGLQAIGQQSSALSQLGAANAAGTVGSANAISGGLSSGANLALLQNSGIFGNSGSGNSLFGNNTNAVSTADTPFDLAG